MPFVEPIQSLAGLGDALGTLDPRVQRLVLALADGADMGEAMAEACLGWEEVGWVLPRLRDFLRPHLFG